MKRIAMLMVVMAMAIAAPASAGWIWNVNASDTNNTNYGSSVTLSNNMNLTAEQSFLTATAAYASSVIYTGSADTGADFAKTKLLKTDMRLVQTRYIIQAHAGADYGMATMDLRFWGGTNSNLAGVWTVTKLYDPITNVWGREVMGTVDASVTKGTQAAPLLKLNMPVFKTGTPTGALNGYLFEFAVPEPGSMVAMLSGLVGLVGFGIRRRR